MKALLIQIGYIIDAIPLEFVVIKNVEHHLKRTNYFQDLFKDVHVLLGNLRLCYTDHDDIFKSVLKITDRVNVLCFRSLLVDTRAQTRKIPVSTISKESLPMQLVPVNFKSRYAFCCWMKKFKTFKSLKDMLGCQDLCYIIMSWHFWELWNCSCPICLQACHLFRLLLPQRSSGVSIYPTDILE